MTTTLNVSASPVQRHTRDKVFLGLPADLAFQQAQALLAETANNGNFIYDEVHVGSKETGINLIIKRPALSCYWNESNQP